MPCSCQADIEANLGGLGLSFILPLHTPQAIQTATAATAAGMLWMNRILRLAVAAP